jgi:hypothetical protein
MATIHAPPPQAKRLVPQAAPSHPTVTVYGPAEDGGKAEIVQL